MRLSVIKQELPALLRLAWPLVLGELGWTAMGIVDTVMVGRLPHSAVPMAAASLAQVLFNTVAIACGGVLIALDTLISESFGAGEHDAANRWLWHGLAVALALSAVLVAVLLAIPTGLRRLPADAAILSAAVPALRGLIWGVVPLLAYFALRRYLQAAHHTGVIAFAVVSANLINAAGDWLLIFPHRFSGRALHGLASGFGVVGSSWSTSLSRTYIALVLLLAVLFYDRRHGYGVRRVTRRLSRERLRRIFALGTPIGAQIFVEIGIFALVTIVCATLGALPLAGHEVALQCAGTSFMVPLAVSSATAVRVGFSLGRLRIGQGTAERVAAAGWSGVLVGSAFMLVTAVLFVSLPAAIGRLFTPDRAVIAAAVPLIVIAAGFQFFDGVQVTLSGALRGLGNTLAPLWAQLIFYWAVAGPLGLVLCFHFHMGARGLWFGLMSALIGAAVALLAIWRRAVRQLLASYPA